MGCTAHSHNVLAEHLFVFLDPNVFPCGNCCIGQDWKLNVAHTNLQGKNQHYQMIVIHLDEHNNKVRQGVQARKEYSKKGNAT